MSARSSLLALTALAVASATPAVAVPFAGLVNDVTVGSRLVGFDSAAPGVITSTLTVTGLRAGEFLNAIDTRPATGELYALGSRDVSIPDSLYTINTTTGVATFVATSSIPLNASGIAFDPVTDTIRTVGSLGNENVRVNPATGVAAADTPLAYAAGDANAGADPFVGAIGYTNQDQDPVTGTQLFGIDLSRGALVRLNQPSNGLLTTVGATGASFPSFGGFDIVAPTTAFATSGLGNGVIGFNSIDLRTGAATLIGAFSGTGAATVLDIAQVQISPGQPIPEPATTFLLGVGLAGLFAARRRIG